MTSFIGLCAGLTAMFAWGTADFFVARAARRTSAWGVLFRIELLGFFLFAIVAFLFGGFVLPSGAMLFLLAAVSFCFVVGLGLFYRSLELGPIALTSPVASAYPVVSVVLAMMFFGERLTGTQWLAVACVLGGILFATAGTGNDATVAVSSQRATRGVPSGVFFALGAFLLFGVFFAVQKSIIDVIGWIPATLWGYGFQLGWLLVGLMVLHREAMFAFARRGWRADVFAAAFLQLTGIAAYNFGAERELTAILAPISAAYPIVTIFLAVVILRDRLRTAHVVAASCIIFGMAILLR